jgi:hypothetical protein
MNRIIFVTKVRTNEGKKLTYRLIQSIRTFGGALSSCPVWVFAVNSTQIPCQNLEGEMTQVIRLNVPDHLLNYDLRDKVYACTIAEELASDEINTLTWIDPTCLVANPPVLYGWGRRPM